MANQEAQGPRHVFLNVDLEIDSTQKIDTLVDALEPYAYSMERPDGRACFELNDDDAREPEQLILEFVRLIVGLPSYPLLRAV